MTANASGFCAACLSCGVDPGVGTYRGPITGTSIGWYTDATFVGTNVPVTAVAGVNLFSTPSTLVSNAVNFVQSRCIAGAMQVIPTSALTSQSGSLLLTEQPAGHSANDFNTYANDPCNRVVSAIGIGQGTRVVLNWHPQYVNAGVGADMDPFMFVGYVTAPTSMAFGQLLIMYQGTANVTFDIIWTQIFELKGLKIEGKKRRVTDSRGADLVFNALAQKRRYGYVTGPTSQIPNPSIEVRESAPAAIASTMAPIKEAYHHKVVSLGSKLWDHVPKAITDALNGEYGSALKEVSGIFF